MWGISMVRGFHAYKIGGMLLMGNHLASKIGNPHDEGA